MAGQFLLPVAESRQTRTVLAAIGFWREATEFLEFLIMAYWVRVLYGPNFDCSCHDEREEVTRFFFLFLFLFLFLDFPVCSSKYSSAVK